MSVKDLSRIDMSLIFAIVKGRSAMEVAKPWFRQSIAAPPVEVVQMLVDHFQQNVDFHRVVPELVTSLLSVPGRIVTFSTKTTELRH